ncbi:MAG: hypothetical protein Q8O25_14370 [Sulfurisoma sp.]|nr:hypothetical protein [Sulfurisoma sp.]
MLKEHLTLNAGLDNDGSAPAVPPAPTFSVDLSSTWRALLNFRPHEDYLADVAAITRPALVLVGAADELFVAERYAPLLEPRQPLLRARLLPGVNHIGIVIDQPALDFVAAAINAS